LTVITKTVQQGRHLALSVSWRIPTLAKAGDATPRRGMT